MKSKKVATLGIMGALALVLGFMENMLVPDIPFLPVGAKPGLSNIVTMYAATAMGLPGAVYITFIKVIFALITRGVTASFMSLCGGLLSALAVSILIKYEGKIFSFLGIGITGALMHNMGQLFGASVISGTFTIFNYAKYLLIFSLITGAVTGSMLMLLMPRLNKLQQT
ncbi:MAG: Gx transporter family protein [Clostridia bacterium]|nr:Gx transporter family protein [Clostridia bacterium]